jgi:hypothetical protein
MYTSGLLAGLIIAPLAAGIPITLGFIGLRRKPRGGCAFLHIEGLVLVLLAWLHLFPYLSIFWPILKRLFI